MWAISRSGLSHWWYAMKWDIVLGVASAFHEASAWYTRAWGNSKRGWCRHQAGAETSLQLASTWLAHECLILHGSVPQRGGAPPERSPAKSAVGAVPLHCPAVSFPPCLHDATEANVVEILRVPVEGPVHYRCHCYSNLLWGRKGEKKKNSQVQSLLERQAVCFTHWTSSVSSAVVLAQAGPREIGDINWRELITLPLLCRIPLQNTVAVYSPNELLRRLSPIWLGKNKSLWQRADVPPQVILHRAKTKRVTLNATMAKSLIMWMHTLVLSC